MGPNGIGKSNFLDALRFLADIARPGGGLHQALQVRGGFEKIKFAAAKKKESVEIEIHLADSSSSDLCYRYSLGLAADPSGSPHLAYERGQRNEELILDRPDKNDADDPARLTKTMLEKASSDKINDELGPNSPIKEIADFLGSTRYLDFRPELLRHQDPFPPADLPGDPFGRKILQRAAEMPATERDRRIKIIEDVLKLAIPQMPKFKFSSGRSGSPGLEATFEIGRPRAKFKQDRISDGTLAAFAILWCFMEDGPLLVLEKPESFLNPGTIHRLCMILYLKSVLGKEKQLIMSTHSPEFLKDDITPISAEEILLLVESDYKEGSKAFLASSFPPIVRDMKRGMSADEAVPYYAGPLDLMDMLSDLLDSGLNSDKGR
jgi:predicted ATPase